MPGPSWTRARPGPIARPIASPTGAATCGPNSPCVMSSSAHARAVPPSPSPIERLTALLSLDLLTEADLDGFSPGVRAIAVKMGAIVRMPREIVTRDPDTDEELPPPRVLVVSGREVEVRVVTDLRDEESEGLGLAPCHVGLEVDYRGEAKIVEVEKLARIQTWEKIAFEVEMWIDRNDPWSWQGEATH